MGGIFSAIGSTVTLVEEVALWPVTITTDIKEQSKTSAYVGVAATGAVGYYALANPMTLLEEEKWVPLAAGYVALGVTYVLARNVTASIVSRKTGGW